MLKMQGPIVYQADINCLMPADDLVSRSAASVENRPRFRRGGETGATLSLCVIFTPLSSSLV